MARFVAGRCLWKLCLNQSFRAAQGSAAKINDVSH